MPAPGPPAPNSKDAPAPPPVPSSKDAPKPPDSAINPLKRPIDQAEVEKRDTYQPPKRRGHPYGEWNTVAVVEKEEEPVENRVADGGEKEEEEVDDEEIQFEEKTISKGLAEEENRELKGEFKGFSFKKRTNKEKIQIRQRTSDV